MQKKTKIPYYPLKMWKPRWERGVQSNGDYFKGCHGPDDEE